MYNFLCETFFFLLLLKTLASWLDYFIKFIRPIYLICLDSSTHLKNYMEPGISRPVLSCGM